jgi:sRNA-binding protein
LQCFGRPIAFPVKSDEVRPLTVSAVGEIAAAMGWSVPYTLGVLAPWKMTPVYCRAVLAHDQRVTLDGAPAEPVDAKAKDLATKRLAHLAARHAAKQASASAKAKPKPAAPAEAPTLRDQVRAGLLCRRA